MTGLQESEDSLLIKLKRWTTQKLHAITAEKVDHFASECMLWNHVNFTSCGCLACSHNLVVDTYLLIRGV